MKKETNTAARITFIAITVVIYIHIYIYSFGSIRLLFAPSMQYSCDPVKNATFHSTFYACKSISLSFGFSDN